MKREELKKHCQKQIEACELWARHNGEEPHGKVYEEHKLILELLEQEPKSEWEHDHEILKAYSDGANGVLEEIRAEIKTKIEEEEFARSVFRREEKDKAKAEQCTGSIMAYNNMIKLIDKYKAESEDNE